MREERCLIKDLIEISIKNEDFCNGCPFLRSNNEYNYYGDILVDYGYNGRGYVCMLELTQGTMSLGYAEGVRLIDDGTKLRRSHRCKYSYLRFSEVLLRFIKNIDLATIHEMDGRETGDYLTDISRLLQKILKHYCE